MPYLNPEIGPVVGYTQEHKIRIMAALTDCPISGKLYCGWVRFQVASKVETDGYLEPVLFRFNSDFYYTGVIEIGNLESATEYSYQVCYRSDFTNYPPQHDSDWVNIRTYKVRTAQGAGSAIPNRVALGFGSCLRKPKHDRSGKVLRSLAAIHQGTPIDAFLWLGDQIYNDPLLKGTLFNTHESHFMKRYEEFFANQYVSSILSSMPNHMILDDHEVTNDYVHGQEEYRAENARFSFRLENALLAYQAYQLSHGNIYDVNNPGSLESVAFVKGQGNYKQPSRYYTTLSFGDVGVFMTDTRNEREMDVIIKEEQFKAIESFLINSQYRVKIVATSVTFLSDPVKLDWADNWAYTTESKKQRLELIKKVTKAGVKNVFFIAGDVHCHFACQLEKDNHPTGIHELVSGSLFWPIRRVFRRDFGRVFRCEYGDFRFGRVLSGAENYGYYVSEPFSEFASEPRDAVYEENGFGFIEVTKENLIFRVIDSDSKDQIRYTFDLV